MPPNAMADCVFPEDMMICILTRLPVKSILRFKSVCKPWRDLFSTPEFIKFHHDQFSIDPKNQSVIIHSRTAHDSNIMSLFNIESNEKKPMSLDHPYTNISNDMDFVGCCNGLLCMGCPPHGKWIDLWNPATQLSKSVELSKPDLWDPWMVSLGFGYDAEGDDFIMVGIVCLKIHMEETNTSIGVNVYSVNSDSWRTIEVDFQFSLPRTKSEAIVNGNPYWVAKVVENGSAKRVLLWFDVTKLVFEIVPLSTLHMEEGTEVQWVDWKGSIGALVCTKDIKRVESLDVWVFDNVEQIWRKKHTFGPIEVQVDRFLQCSENGKILGERPGGKLFVFDPQTGWVKKVWLYGAQPGCFEIYGYTESLVYIEGMKQVRLRNRKKKVIASTGN